jgi:hypothetical protein
LATWLDGSVEVLTINYRGQGTSGGRATEDNARHDLLCLIDYARSLGRIDDLTIAGRSLGSAMAVWLASVAPCQRLLLLTPIDSLRSVLESRFWFRPFAWTYRLDFNAIRYANLVRAPTSILLSERDSQVPHAHSLRLARRLGTFDLAVAKGANHCNLGRHENGLQLLAWALHGKSLQAAAAALPEICVPA